MVGLALAAVAGTALVVLALKEFAGILRQRHIAELHIGLARAREKDDFKEARRLVGQLSSLYDARPETSRARGQLRQLAHDIVDGSDLIDIAERTLVEPLDMLARHEIAAAAKRVSVVTALAPRAIIDVVFVAAQAIRLIRRIATIYGGRPGLLGFLKLLRSIASHIAITGGMAAGDSLIQQFVGHGIAAEIVGPSRRRRFERSLDRACRTVRDGRLPPPALRDQAATRHWRRRAVFVQEREERVSQAGGCAAAFVRFSDLIVQKRFT